MISVVVPVYRVEDYLDRCVESIVGQTYRNLEIILVDDGSPDNCPAMCDAWAEKDSRIRVIHKQNGGLSDARNAGMAVAAGEYIGFVDSDDWIDERMYEKLLDAMARDGSEIAVCSVQMVWEDGGKRKLLTQSIHGVFDRLDAQRALLEESKLKQPVWYKLYRRETVAQIPFEVGKYHEDVFWSYRAIGNAEKISIIDYVGYFYWQRSCSIMGEGYSLKRLDAMDAYCRRYEYFSVSCPELENEALTAIWNGCIYHGQMALQCLSGTEKIAALDYLRGILKRYPLSWRTVAGRPIKQAIWLSIGKISLCLTCRIRNFLRIGL